MAERTKVVTPPFRVSFPQVFEAKGFNGGEPKYSVVMLFDMAKINANPQYKASYDAMQAILKEAATAKFGAKLPSNLKKAFRDGEEKAGMDGYGAGIKFATASSKMRPGVVDRNKQPILSADDFYSGCWARATVTAYGYDQKGNKGVSFGLQNLQKLGEGESFSGRIAAENDFDDDADKVWSDEGGSATGATEDDGGF